MANLEKLIAFWEKVYNAKNANLPPNILIHIDATISALSELKRLKEGIK